jgi:aldehyde:ferredoxin oxidoreductase
MLNGWTGTSLDINLTTGAIEKKERSSDLNGNFLGGRGTNSKILWDRVAPESTPFSSDNLLVFGAGVLTGTLAPGANRTAVSTRSPVINLQTWSLMGGFWAPELKYAGYDEVIISGKSPTSIYLWINDDKVEIRDARHLWGKDTQETRRIIQDELKNNNVQILCIGPAGENKVYAASIEQGSGTSASRAGVGAIMGDKNLKAIAVHGTKDVNIAKPSEFIELCGHILKRTEKLSDFASNYPHHNVPGQVNNSYSGNWGELPSPWPDVGDVLADFLERYGTNPPTCYNCQIRCKSASLPDGEQVFVKCSSWTIFMNACKIRDFTFSLKCHNLCDRYGLDHKSTANIIAFAIDIYEKGILTKEETGGMHLEWGNADLAFTLIRNIARREGIGDVLANGVYEAARVIGRGAENHAYHVKKLEIKPSNLYVPERAYTTALSDRADRIKMLGEFGHRLKDSKEHNEAYIKSGFFPYPKEFQKYLEDPYDWSGADYERQAQFISYDADKITLSDCAGLCKYWTGHWRYAPIQGGDIANLISYATGMDLDEGEAIKIAKRVGNLIKAYNFMVGLRREDD